MSIGVLWFDDDPVRILDKKVQAACAAYAQKFAVKANICYVHPSALGTAVTTMVGNVTVKADRKMLPHHYFAVREDD